VLLLVLLLLLQVPADQVASTPIQLMATAGLRMLSNGSAEAIMTEVRTGAVHDRLTMLVLWCLLFPPP
jgi:hypothetical protein